MIFQWPQKCQIGSGSGRTSNKLASRIRNSGFTVFFIYPNKYYPRFDDRKLEKFAVSNNVKFSYFREDIQLTKENNWFCLMCFFLGGGTFQLSGSGSRNRIHKHTGSRFVSHDIDCWCFVHPNVIFDTFVQCRYVEAIGYRTCKMGRLPAL